MGGKKKLERVECSDVLWQEKFALSVPVASVTFVFIAARYRYLFIDNVVIVNNVARPRFVS